MFVKTFSDAIQTQSQNSSAKMALCVDEFLLNHLEFHGQENYKWNQLNIVIHLKYEAFIFRGYSFFYRMFRKVINDLIPTGIMSHLVNNFYTKSWIFKEIRDERKVLSVSDLLFGFKIWIVCCIASAVTFGVEQRSRFVKKPKKVRFAKIFAEKNTEINEMESYKKMNLELISKFRVQNKNKSK